MFPKLFSGYVVLELCLVYNIDIVFLKVSIKTLKYYLFIFFKCVCRLNMGAGWGGGGGAWLCDYVRVEIRLSSKAPIKITRRRAARLISTDHTWDS